MPEVVRASSPPFDAGPPQVGSSRVSRAVERTSRAPGMSFGHDVLLALIMAIAMAATVFLYR